MLLAFKNFQEFIDHLDKNGELIRIKTPVSTDLEITEITDRVSKDSGKALLFENVKDSQFPVVTNAFGSPKRVELAFGQSVDRVAQKIEELIKSQIPEGITDDNKGNR